MGVGETDKINILAARRLPFRLSKTALGLILATIFMGIVLTFSTIQNINRAQNMMERFLRQKGETIVRVIEAAMRTSAMHHMAGSGTLDTLLAESSRGTGVAYILVADLYGDIAARTDDAPDLSGLEAVRSAAGLEEKETFWLDREEGVYTIARPVVLYSSRSMMGMMGGIRGQHRGKHDADWSPQETATIYIGLYTEPFDNARKQDVQHALFMGAILFLLGSAGLYFLFLYQGMSVARSTLANMKLYTDNVIESIPVGLVTLNAEDRLVSCNRQAEKIIGCSQKVMQEKHVAEVFGGCMDDTAAIRRAELDLSLDCTFGDGRSVPVKVGGSALVNDLGEVIGTVLVVRDMSNIREMEQQLERSRRMAALGKMAAGIAHEIRNPLSTLKGFAHYLGNQPEITSESKKYINLMKSEVDRLNRNVSGLLQFARPREPNFVELSLGELINKTVALMENDFAEHALEFSWRCDQGETISADPDLLLQVLLNLLKNSVGATAPGGKVILDAAADGQDVRISVTDTGCGIKVEDRERMFDPFFTTKQDGTGLGLAVSHQIVEQHRGSVEVETAVGQGTMITIILPRRRRGE
ncbi:two-component system sensor histidine kinase NtrB [Desulforhopalus singaporensis]|uniref:histidine kinase n=1 Tax=Desulforhopalus singaporensis TaxID=91360 RepID=A0A1H0LV54_9BACT|nr:ATP-binding protein [Desulforhopalus singaporensis]SDO72044.1 two-component system, NtrC family, sensor histidine kinase HydH [Desulforhopalus singaporensis]